MKKGDFSAAEHLLEQVTREQPQASEPWADLCAAQAGLGKYPSAVIAGRKALVLGADPRAVQYCLGWALLNTDEWQEAQTYLLDAVAADAFDPAPVYALGRYFERVGDARRALQQYEQAQHLGSKPAEEAIARLKQALREAVPNEPFWGPPGRTALSTSHAPLLFRGKVVQPVTTLYDTFFFYQDANRLWLAAVRHNMVSDSMYFFPEPVLVTELPYVPGREWCLSDSPTSCGPRLVGFETVVTPSGTFPSLVLQWEQRVEWWSPGVGLVKTEVSGNLTGLAKRVENRPPETVSGVERITDKLTAILGVDGIYDQDGRRLVNFPWPDPEGRDPMATWADIGATHPALIRSRHSQREPIWKTSIWVYQPATGTFVPAPFRFLDGTSQTEVVGRLENQQPGSIGGNAKPIFSLYGSDHRPSPFLAFQWADGELKEIPGLTLSQRASGSEEFSN